MNSPSQFEINDAIGRHDAVFISHVFERTKIDSSAGVFNQKPARRDVPQADPGFNIRVESSAREVSHVERCATKHSALAHEMNHRLEQWEIRVDRVSSLGEAD